MVLLPSVHLSVRACHFPFYYSYFPLSALVTVLFESVINFFSLPVPLVMFFLMSPLPSVHLTVHTCHFLSYYRSFPLFALVTVLFGSPINLHLIARPQVYLSTCQTTAPKSCFTYASNYPTCVPVSKASRQVSWEGCEGKVSALAFPYFTLCFSNSLPLSLSPFTLVQRPFQVI